MVVKIQFVSDKNPPNRAKTILLAGDGPGEYQGDINSIGIVIMELVGQVFSLLMMKTNFYHCP